MTPVIIVLVIIVLAVVALVLLRLKERHARESMLMERVRTSAMYSRLYPVLDRCCQCCIERIIIRPEEVRIVLYKPMNRTYRFVFEDHGIDPVDQPAALQALSQAVALDVPCLADPNHYYFRVHTAPRDGGGNYRWYEYAVQPDYKDMMLRAWYDHTEPEDGIIR
ncbi:MAG: hypothetical protein IJ438_08790 [Clostridia bacterium]|nr:hypothetical protein [Clostridia bacterium]